MTWLKSAAMAVSVVLAATAVAASPASAVPAGSCVIGSQQGGNLPAYYKASISCDYGVKKASLRYYSNSSGQTSYGPLYGELVQIGVSKATGPTGSYFASGAVVDA
ncbi:MAG: hypothetical protein LBK59_11635 [Bifidobacteriaceae bacterium]|jgi:hypothetical protein|nr:hypothetical protein [Bifidobacteriaceae bacterium]